MSVPSTVPSAPDWQLRVRTFDGDTAGAGVLVSPRHVLTCAHVVCAALGRPWEEAGTPRPAEPVALDAPRGGGAWQAAATVLDDGWFVDRSPWDAAVLLLDRPAPAAPPTLRSRGGADRPGRAVSMVGFSADEAPAGVWSHGVLIGRGGRHHEHVQFDIRSSTSARITGGFSGSGVREDPGGALVGIVCDAHQDDRGLGVSGWMIPVETVPNVWGGDVSAPPSQPLRDSPRTVHALALALAETPTVADPEARREFYRLLAPRIRRSLRVDLAPGLFASRLVGVARDHGLLHEAVAALDLLEEGSPPMRRVWEAAGPLLDRE
ncbi:trypsin-like peptidase domain-containing protein [Thermobifida halotolerans]|uniref:Trypsin-like peptidase domain-containing protein n=1 Tax=Thermobifida halotolerans TaxID=483545 RepID=A0AA97M405_9ACTN|nr:trypsin-like peptidase domain-containing protein [Thermobifida halotolerans]UOE19487.1 trypsin-like peptidase domain-containing protein [Thermobifida halotolerans]